MRLKKRYKIFFAIPFDAFTYNTYKRIIARIQSYQNGIECVIGKETINPNLKINDIQTFKNQNDELFRLLVKQIKEAEIVIADLTNNNPNVHIELGIAMSYNKNILRLCGRELKEVGFDISGFDIGKYKNENDLFNKIKNYLAIFIKIKNLNYVSDKQFCYRDPTQRNIVSS